jgi:hypothetical protein
MHEAHMSHEKKQFQLKKKLNASLELFLFMTASFPSSSIGDEMKKIMNSQNDVIHNLILLGFSCLLSF